VSILRHSKDNSEDSFNLAELEKYVNAQPIPSENPNVNPAHSQTQFKQEEVKLEKKVDEDEKVDMYETVANGSLDQMKKMIRNEFTIKKHIGKKRICLCKTPLCPRKARIFEDGGKFGLEMNQQKHLPECQKKRNLFENTELRNLCHLSRLRPLDILREFNRGKDQDQKIKIDKDSRRHITKIKYELSQKERQPDMIVNTSDLNNWFRTYFPDNNIVSFSQLSPNTPFIANYSINNNEFIGFLTTKNLLLNIVKQSAMASSNLSIDSTWSLNIQGYPTMVIGTKDLRRKFHLSTLTIQIIFNSLLVGFGISNTENKENYSKLLSYFIEILGRVVHDYVLQVRWVMLDGGLFARNAVKEKLPNATVQMCLYHFWEAITPKLKSNSYIPKIQENVAIPKKFEEHLNSSKDPKEKSPLKRAIKFDVKILQSLPNKILYLNYLRLI